MADVINTVAQNTKTVKTDNVNVSKWFALVIYMRVIHQYMSHD